MPIYEFECEDCFDIMERWMRIEESEDAVTKCGNCGGTAHKIMSPNSFHLKGDGWFNKPKKYANED